MKLAKLVMLETQAPLPTIMLLRHSNVSIEPLLRYGATVEEYTAIQPIESKYDYFRTGNPRTSIVVVIVETHVYGVYRVTGIEAEGTNYSIGSDAFKRFDEKRDKDEIRCRRFHLEPVTSISVGLQVYGWEKRERTPVQRCDDSFFDEIEVYPTELKESTEELFNAQVEASLRDTSDVRMKRLADTKGIPTRVKLTTFAFVRNPDVVAEALVRANGACQACRNHAPFIRRSDSSPYLEVHHNRPLAQGGKDIIENAIALCPNCHRKAHYA